MKIAVVVGTRPQFIELAPVIHELQKTKNELLIYHTGQHYDKMMSGIFLKQLDIPEPHYNLQAGGGSHAQQTARMITGCETALMRDSPDLVIVEGDTTSAFASALAAVKIGMPVVHIEAGCRSYDKTLPEEVNRVVISHVARLHFPPTPNCQNNLLKEGISRSAMKLIGHPIVDSINLVRNKIHMIKHIARTKIEAEDYYYVTLHRDFNVDDPLRLKHILRELAKVATKRPVIFPVHPRTKKRIAQFNLRKHLHDIKTLPPVDYITSLSLIKNAYAIITDSGGLTKEGCLFGVPCITLRHNTEWVETLDGYSNQLAFVRGNTIMKCVENLDRNYDKAKRNVRSLQGIFGKIGVSSRIANIIYEWRKSVNR